jgi:hypothetical protein
MAECTPGFMEIARTLGGIDCASTAPLVSVRDPFALANWTLPVVEALMIAGAATSLIHAVRWSRRRGDPTNLALWVASFVYALVLEPPLYFPNRFGLAGTVDLIFVHNLFSVQFLQDRLPLYILALYPALTYLAYLLVQRTGVLERRHPLVAAACVAFVFHCFYEIFDQLGPQLRWWAWNPHAPSNTPWLASVPLTSVAIFAAASPFGIALLTGLLVARRAARGPVPAWSMALRVIGVAVLTPLMMMLFSLPYSLSSLGRPPHVTGQAIALWLVIALLGVVALSGFISALRNPGEAPSTGGFLDRYGVTAGAVFLLVFAVLWTAALPDHLAAAAGRTPSGTPTGSLGYVIACAAACLGVLALVVVITRKRRPAPPADGQTRTHTGRTMTGNGTASTVRT